MTDRWKTSVNSEEEGTGASSTSRGWLWSKWDLRGMETHSPPPQPWCQEGGPAHEGSTQWVWGTDVLERAPGGTEGRDEQKFKESNRVSRRVRGESDSLGLPSSSPSTEAAGTFSYHPLTKVVTLTCAESLACLLVGCSVVSNSLQSHGL